MYIKMYRNILPSNKNKYVTNAHAQVGPYMILCLNDGSRRRLHSRTTKTSNASKATYASNSECI